MIDALAAEIARLNTLAVPEHTVPAGNGAPAGTIVPAGDSSAEKVGEDGVPEGGTQQLQQQLQQIDV